MKKNTVIALAVVAVAAIIAAAFLVSGRKANTGQEESARLFPDLEQQLNELTEVVVSASEQKVTLQRGDAGWTVMEKGGYRADVSTLRKQLVTIGQAEILESKTSNPDLYSRLGVEDPTAEGASSRQIEMKAPGDESWSLIIGNTNFRGGQSTYVRKPGDDQSYSISGAVTFDADPTKWLDRDVMDIATPRVQHVVIEHPDGNSIELVKSEPNQPNFAVVNIPEGRELLSPSAGNSIAGALSGLRLEDVVSEADFNAEDTQPVTAVYETFDGVRATARVWSIGEDRYLAVSVERDPALVSEPVSNASDAEPDAPAVDGSMEPTDDAQAPSATLVDQSEVDELMASVSGWVYKIPSYKYSNLTKKLEDLLKPLEAAENE